MPALEVFAGSAIVADERIRHRDDLARIRRIGQDLLIPGNAGRKDDLAGGAFYIQRSKRAAAEHHTILEHQSRTLSLARLYSVVLAQCNLVLSTNLRISR